MGIYSSDSKLDAFILQAYEALLKEGFTPDPESFKEIPYGIGFSVPGTAKKKETVTIYRTDKKGFSIVTKSEPLRQILAALLSPPGLCGCDEAGKGDIFGPLVAVCCAVTEESRGLLSMPIRDSKEMGDEAILKVYSELEARYRNYFEAVRIMPERYNTFYADLARQGKGLNQLLAWAHSKALAALCERVTGIEKILVDQFSADPRVQETIRKGANGIPVTFAVRAEANFPVAAASVIARATYLRSLKQLSETILEGKITLHSGSGEQADRTIATIRGTFDEERLAKVAKMHFANITR